MYNLLQAAGPNLNARRHRRRREDDPAGRRTGLPARLLVARRRTRRHAGAGDHTTIDDSREIYWVSKDCGTTCAGSSSDPYYNGPDGKAGTYKETYDGKRFRNGEWPNEDPPIYPPK